MNPGNRPIGAEQKQRMQLEAAFLTQDTQPMTTRGFHRPESIQEMSLSVCWQAESSMK